MKPSNFEKYCKKNKVIKISASNFGLSLYFENGKRIDVYDTYDGLKYKFWEKPNKNANKKLLVDLGELTKQDYGKYFEKYGSDSFSLISAFLKQ